MKLFTTIPIGKTEIMNRIVLPPMVTNWATEDHFPSAKHMVFYERICQGGTGLIITEAANVVPNLMISRRQMGIYHNQFIEPLRQLTRVVKPYGVRIFCQLVHAGPKAILGQPVSASSEWIEATRQPKVLERRELDQTIRAFVESAKRAQRSGFDGVELHAAHFYLLSAFLSPATNRRNDEFGGSLRGNSKIVREIIKGVKSELGTDFPIICRINALESVPGGLAINDVIEICRALESDGADAIHASAYVKHTSDNVVGGLPGPRDHQGCYVEYATAIKRSVGIPVIAVGKIFDPKFAEETLERGRADLLAIGRQLFADPDWPKKAREKRTHEINWCTYCSVCATSQGEGREVICPRNRNLGG